MCLKLKYSLQAEDMSDRSKIYALKRLLAMDSEKRDQIIQEIAILKGLSSHENIVKFFTAATVDSTSRYFANHSYHVKK